MTKEEALGKARRLERAGAFEMWAYDCRHCDSWHVGHPLNRRKR